MKLQPHPVQCVSETAAIIHPMKIRPRWDGDARGIGVRSADDAAVALDEFGDQMRRPGWVCEDPIVHLGPKLDAWLADRGSAAWQLLRLSVEEDRLVVDAAWRRDGRVRDLRADAYALIGSFAEASTHVVQRIDGDQVVFEVATGQPDGEFAAHGHLVVLRVSTVRT